MKLKCCLTERRLPLGRICSVVMLFSLFCFAFRAGGAVAGQNPFLADRHQASGLTCVSCHDTKPKDSIEGDKCLGCHENYPAVAKRTSKLTPNPHDNHMIELDCLKCHFGHKVQVNYCQSCHSDMVFAKIKDGAKPAAHH